MYYFFKAVAESQREFEKDFPNGEYWWTAEMGMGYALTHYPIFLLETFVEAMAIFGVVYLIWGR